MKKKREYDVNKLYKQRYLTLSEVGYLLGGIPLQNVYAKLNNGALKYRTITNSKGLPVKRVLARDVLKYVMKRREELLFAANRLRLPTEE